MAKHKTTTSKKPAMSAYQFYELTEGLLKEKASAYRVADLGKYYKLTDMQSDWYRGVKDGDNSISKCFVQLAFHAQNAAWISRVVRFEENFQFLNEVCKRFNPNAFIQAYPDESAIGRLVDDLYGDKETDKGLLWDRTKSKEENKDQIAKRYATALIRGAAYLKRFSSKTELVNNLREQYEKPSCKRTGVEDKNRNLIEYFMSNDVMGKGAGFSVALTCDFLKELDEQFNFLAKPDVHIKEVMAAYFGREENYYHTTAREYECLGDIQGLVKAINDTLRRNKQKEITVYQLDRMIWLICSGNFFLHVKGPNKKDFIKKIWNS